MGSRSQPPMADYYAGGGKARQQHTKCKPAPFQTRLQYGQNSIFEQKGALRKLKTSPGAGQPPVSEPIPTDYTTTFASSYGVEPAAYTYERLRKQKGNTEESVTREWTTTQGAIGTHSGEPDANAKTALVQKRSKVQSTLTYDPWSTTNREVGQHEGVQEVSKGQPEMKTYFPEQVDYTTTNQEMMWGKPEEKPKGKGRARGGAGGGGATKPNPYKTSSGAVGGFADGFKNDKTAKTREYAERAARTDHRDEETDILGAVNTVKESEMIKEYADNTAMAFNSFLMPGGVDRSKVSKVKTQLAYGQPKHVAYKVRKKLGELNMEHVLDE